MDTEHTLAQRFTLELDKKIHRIVEAITHTTYVAARRVAKAMGGEDGSQEPPPLTITVG